MKVDAPGLVAAAQRLIGAVAAVGAGEPHPPLAADPASLGAAGRLSTAGAELNTALAAHVSGLVASLEQLAGVAVTYLDTDARNAGVITALNAGAAGGAAVAGFAPPAPPIPPDVRAPIPPPAGLLPDAISAAVHAGSPDAGEPFVASWSAVAGAARDASAHLRSAVASLPDTLDGPASTPAVQRHLLSYADGLDTYAERAQNLAHQATVYADNLWQVVENTPAPQTLDTARNKVQTLSAANARSGGAFAVPLGNAVGELNQLNEQTVTGYTGYHVSTDAATAGEDPGQAAPGGAGGGGAAGAGPGTADPAADPAATAAGDVGSMGPDVLSSMVGMVGDLAGTMFGPLVAVPQALAQAGMQAGTQAMSAATSSLSSLAKPKLDPPNAGTGGGEPGAGDGPGDSGGGDAAPTTPASGGGAPELGVAPSTGAPPAPAIAPAGAGGGPASSSPAAGGAMGGMGAMGMPMGMGALGGAPGGAGGAGGKGDADRRRKVVVPEVPHTEDITGRVDTNRLSVAAAANRDRDPEPPDPDNPPAPVVRRLVSRPPREPS